MMRTLIAAGAFIVALTILQTSAAAAETELDTKSRQATAADVPGTWEMTYQVVRPGMGDSAFFSEHQVLQFLETGHVKNYASTSPLTPDKVRLFLETMPAKTSFEFPADGLLLVKRSESDMDRIVISMVTKDFAKPLREGAPLLTKGTLLLSYLDPSGKLYMQRYLKRYSGTLTAQGKRR